MTYTTCDVYPTCRKRTHVHAQAVSVYIKDYIIPNCHYCLFIKERITKKKS